MATTSTASFYAVTDQSLIASYNRGPITSLFVPPASCTATLTFAFNTLYFGHMAGYFDKDCYPTGFGGSQAPIYGSAWDAYYYSPAICPFGWTVASSNSQYLLVNAGPSPNHIPLGSETTAGVCCPSGYSYFKEGHQCASKVDSSQFISIFSATFDGQSFVKGTAQPQSWLTSTSISGDGIPIMWQSKDADVLSRARAMTPTITAPPSAPTSTPTNTNTSAPSSGLSTGAKIGLGVGIPIAVIFVLVLGFLLWRRRSKKHRSVEASAPAYEQHTGAAEYKDGRGEQAYYQAQPVHEMQDLNQTHRTTHELPGGGQR